jgi:uncharacterized protein (DUF1810 family)
MGVRLDDIFDSLRYKPMSLRLHIERFKLAQDQPEAGFDRALSELRAGGKTSDWIWYVCPQLAGLGHSETSQFYAIQNVAEASEYLRDPLLRSRLLRIANEILRQHRAGVPLRRLMGSPVDLLKLVSSMTLFGAVARKMMQSEPGDECVQLADAADDILQAAKAEGYPPCQVTLRKMP